MQILHAKSVTIADVTGTATGWFGSTTVSVPATALQRPSDWNSAHNLGLTLAGGNTTQNSTWSGTNLSFSGAGNVSLGLSGNTLVISGGGNALRNYFNPQDGYVQVAGQQGNATMHIQPAYIPAVTLDRVAMPIVVTNSTNSTGTVTISVGLAIYTRNVSTMSLYLSTSASVAITFSGSVNNSTYAGMRLLTFGWSTSIPENQYYVGIWSRTTTGGGNCTVNQFLASQANSVFSGILGVASNASDQYTRGLGHFSTTFSTALPNSVAIADIRGTASIALRQPVFYFVNGTF